jgi:CubicO group peptidase (beta-lactamase class C family)
LADYSELADYHTAVALNETPWPADEMLQRLDASRLRYAPGEGWRYSNVGYLWVARIIERITDLSLEQALTQRVFAPLGLAPAHLAKNRSDLNGANMGSASTYDPGWVYHGLLVGPLDQAALCLDRLLSGDFLTQRLLQDMQAARALGGPIAGRPWTSPGYALGLMQGAVSSGLVLSGHTGAGPGSTIAVYRSVHAGIAASCAVFHEGSDEGVVEAEAVKYLGHSLGTL